MLWLGCDMKMGTMTVVNAASAQKSLYQLMSDVNESSAPVVIINEHGKNAVLLSEDDWRAIQETVYLNAIPGMAESILAAGQEPSAECTIYHQV